MHSVIEEFDGSKIEALEIKLQAQQERYMELCNLILSYKKKQVMRLP
jgi:hypothetical protein